MLLNGLLQNIGAIVGSDRNADFRQQLVGGHILNAVNIDLHFNSYRIL